jgi:L-lactate dehydrogenase complex protein LldE
MHVSLFVTCLIDQFWPSIGTATVEVLRRAGCSVEFDARQTCCSQPAFNSGWRKEARSVARAMLDIYDESRADAIVLPSGSCTAMLRHLPELFPAGDPDHDRAVALGRRTHELAAFLVDVLGVTDLGAVFPARLTWHDACHGLRDLGLRDEPRRLIERVSGAVLIETASAETCCGFGGTFSVKYPEISVAMLDHKLQAIEEADVDFVVSSDASCLIQIGGRLARLGSRVRAVHLAEVLAGEPEAVGS